MTDFNDRATRYRVNGMDVVYDTGEGYWSGPVVDASSTGLFIETTHELPVGTKVTVVLPDDQLLPFDVLAVVVRVNELNLDEHWDRTPGIALRFEGLDQLQIAEVNQYLRNQGVPVH